MISQTIVKPSVTLLVLLLPFNLMFGQTKPLTTDSDTSYWYDWNRSKEAKLNVSDLRLSGISNDWRLWYNGEVTSYVLDLRKAEIILYTKEVVNEGEKATNRIFCRTYQLQQRQIITIDSLIESSQVNSIPSDKYITGWGDFLDGVTYNIERIDNDRYSFKSYDTPESADIKEGVKLNEFIKKLEAKIRLKELDRDFVKSVPFAMYNTGGPMTAIKALTPKEARKVLREQKQYLKGKH